MMRFLRYVLAFGFYTLWCGGRIVAAAFRRVPQRRGGIYDRAAREWGRFLCAATRLRVEVEGRERLDPERPCVYIANHVSFVDIWALLAELPGTVRFVAKQELTRVPVLGHAMVAAGHICIDRQNRSAAFAAYDAAAGRIRAGTSAVVFAEGTRSRDGTLRPFKKGPFVLAIAAGVPVIPICVAGTHAIMPRGALCPRPGVVTLRVGHPIPTHGLGYDDRDRLADRTRAALLALGSPVPPP
jgi:1-acyl-sn-glycerol-3-phosphate acyltransferase